MRFKIEKSVDPGHWVITDLQNQVVVKWEDHKFNDTQKVTFLEEDKEVIRKLGANGIARVMAEIADHLRENHYSKVF